jgi:hypothetical protein
MAVSRLFQDAANTLRPLIPQDDLPWANALTNTMRGPTVTAIPYNFRRDRRTVASCAFHTFALTHDLAGIGLVMTAQKLAASGTQWDTVVINHGLDCPRNEGYVQTAMADPAIQAASAAGRMPLPDLLNRFQAAIEGKPRFSPGAQAAEREFFLAIATGYNEIECLPA